MKMTVTNHSIFNSALLLMVIGVLAGCEPGPYGNNDWRYPQNSYPSYPQGGYYPAPGNYGGGYYPPPPPPPRYDNRYDNHYDDRYDDRRYDDRRYEDRDRHHHHDDPPPPPPPPATPPPAQPSTVRPSCPSGTTFNGRHCMIDDKSKIRPGGKGTVNACPKGMRLSGDRCIDN